MGERRPVTERSPIEFAAERWVGSSPERIFVVLADLRRHWPLLGGALAEAQMLDGERARLVLRLPPPLGWLGVSRTIETEVIESSSPRLLRGRACAGASSALIEWTVVEQCVGDATGSLVRFSAVITPGNALDEGVLRLARPWLARSGRRVLERLDATALALDEPIAAGLKDEPLEGTVS